MSAGNETPQTNPYEATSTEKGQVVEDSGVPRRSDFRAGVTGALYAAFGIFPIAPFVALVFRFPVPFRGYMSGVDAVVPAFLSVGFYGLLFGGFLALGALGGGAALLCNWTFSNPRHAGWAHRIAGLGVATTFCLVLATLDWFIGPW